MFLALSVVATGPWCPLWHDIYEPKMYDPSAPIRLLPSGEWHMYPDGCGKNTTLHPVSPWVGGWGVYWGTCKVKAVS